MSPDQQGQQFNNGVPPAGPQPSAPPPPMSSWQPQNNDPFLAGGMPGSLPTEPIIRPVKQGKRASLAGLSVLALLLIGGAAAAYQFLYVPNTPAAIFKTGMQRSGETLDKLVADATAEPKLKVIEQSVISGTVSVQAADNKYNGRLMMSSDLDTNDIDLTVDMTDQDGKKTDIGLQLLTQLVNGKQLPDAYFKLQGIKALGFDAYLPGISKYDNQWVGVSADYLETLFPEEAAAAGTEDMLSAADVAEITKVVMKNVRTYILTDDPSVAVLRQKRFVGTEQIASDITANRYVVSLNKANAKKFCESVINDVTASEMFKQLPAYNAETLEDNKRSAREDCNKQIDGIKDGDNLELWIDTSYKLISKFRISEPEQAKSYVEVGQSYKGGDELPLFMALHDEADKADGRIDILSNIKQSTAKTTVTYDIKGDDPFKLKLSLDVKPADKPVEIQKPATFTPLQNVLKELGLEGLDTAVPALSQPAANEG